MNKDNYLSFNYEPLPPLFLAFYRVKIHYRLFNVAYADMHIICAESSSEAFIRAYERAPLGSVITGSSSIRFGSPILY